LPILKTEGDHLAVSDAIYERNDKKVEFMIKQRRLKLKQGKPIVKSMAEQRMEGIEEQLEADRNLATQFKESVNVTEVHNKIVCNDENKMTQEKLKGRFDLLVNPKLPVHTRISKFLNEPIVFHLHKNGIFLKKITD
jgi:hypothetical protein